MIALVNVANGDVASVNGASASPVDSRFLESLGAGATATVPDIVAAWTDINANHGALGLAECLKPATDPAAQSTRLGSDVGDAAREQVSQLKEGGAADWAVVRQAGTGDSVRQSELPEFLGQIASAGSAAFYEGEMARAVGAAVAETGGSQRREFDGPSIPKPFRIDRARH